MYLFYFKLQYWGQLMILVNVNVLFDTKAK